jgi:hypothetical protein
LENMSNYYIQSNRMTIGFNISKLCSLKNKHNSIEGIIYRHLRDN